MQQLIYPNLPVTVCRASAGTGKTYTLAAYYVGLLLSGEDYRSILAITFTNKATSEMSERIMSYLYGISEGGERAFLSRVRQFMLRDAQVSDEELERRAGRCFRRMLLDYDNVRIQTIDSFLQTLLSGLAGVLRMSAGLNTELDIDHVINTAVEQLVTTEMTPADRSILVDYMRLKLDEENQTDVRQSLSKMAKELYNESVQVLDSRGEICFDVAMIERRRQALEQQWEQCEERLALKALLDSIDPTDFNKNVRNAYERLRMSVEEPQKMSSEDRFRGIFSKVCSVEEVNKATELAAKAERVYNTIFLTIRFSRDMELMSSLQALIQRNLAEANCALLARTASTLSEALREGDADFILEKAGIRYKHVLIDEFQDTSQLQWSVINRLLMDVLAGVGHTLLIVGDIKQSIYRWRNGDWHIMDELNYPNTNPSFTSLTKNFRSSEHVVRFNLSLFKYLMAHYAEETGCGEDQSLIERIYNEGFDGETIDPFYQSDRKKGGYVRFRAFPKRRAPKQQADEAPVETIPVNQLMVMNMFDAMEDLLRKGASPTDFLVLVRKGNQASLITDLHSGLLPADYPHLCGTRIVSASSYLLEASQAVLLIISGLRYVANGDEVAAKFIEFATQQPDVIERIRCRVTRRTPLYEAVCELVSILLTDDEGKYNGSETAYINCMLDSTRDYVRAYGSNLDEFLIYWEDTLHTKSIPIEASDAIRILTIHTSKGLQAQTVFIPFCNWDMDEGDGRQQIWCRVAPELEQGDDYVPISGEKTMQQSAYSASYAAEHQNLRIDSINMLYVALTRAEDNLYLSAEFSVTSKGQLGSCSHVGKYVLDYCELNGEIVRTDLPVTSWEAPYAEKSFGSPVIKVRKPVSASSDAVKEMNPFSFNGSIEQEAELWANSDQVRFVQSQEGALYTDYGETSYRRVARMDEGVLCHEIFAQLRRADQLEQVLDAFESRGEIASKEQREELKALISSAWDGNEQMRDWFTSPWELRLEQPIYMDHRELRPDRVMINPISREAIVLDYKFGQWEDKYIQQVKEYMQALRRMNYSPVRGYLWFARQGKLVEVVESRK